MENKDAVLFQVLNNALSVACNSENAGDFSELSYHKIR